MTGLPAASSHCVKANRLHGVLKVGAAAGVEVLAGDPAGLVGGEEGGDVGDVGGLAEAVEGGLVGEVSGGCRCGAFAFVHVGFYISGVDGVDGYGAGASSLARARVKVLRAPLVME